MGWEVFLTVELSKRVESKVHELAKSLIDVEVDGVGLMGGSAGVACFCAYYADWTADLHFGQLAAEMVERSIHPAPGFFPGLRFSEGLAGLGWTIDHLISENFLTFDATPLFRQLDDPLYRAMTAEMESGHYDYLHGALGYALYFLRDADHPQYRQYLEGLVGILRDKAEVDGRGTRWTSMLDDKRKLIGVNLSLSHGMASVMIMLMNIRNSGVAVEQCDELLRGGLQFLEGEQFANEHNISCFPSWANEGPGETIHSRLAWCYGDLGIGLGFLKAGKAFPGSGYELKGMEILLHSSKRRDPVLNRVHDAGICHGSAGLALIYNTIYQNTGIGAFREASLYWLDVCLNMAVHDDGIGGYKAFYHPRHGGWVRSPGLLEGAAGIGLSLLSFIHHRKPSWARSLLLEV